MKLREYQEKALEAAFDYLHNDDGNGLIVMATGTGKSLVIAGLVQYVYKEFGARVCICTHNSDLVLQNYQEYMALEPMSPSGICSAGLGKKQKLAPILFAGIQSVFRNPHDLGKIDLLIVDEAHSIPRNSITMWWKFIAALKDMNPRARVMGLTATDFRLDSGMLTSGEDALFDEVIYEYGLLEAVTEGYLSELIPKSMATKIDLSNVHKRGGEFIDSELQAAIDTDAITTGAVKELIEYGANRKTWMIFCSGVDHCHHVAAEIIRCGFSCAVVTGDTPQKEREEIYAKLKRHEIRAVCSVAVMTTGTNIPCIDLIAGLRPTESGGLLVQMLGRGTRPMYAPGMPLETALQRKAAIKAGPKPNCLYLDYSGNLQRHGPIDKIKGKDKKEGDGIPPMKLCPVCSTIVHISVMQCPDCGYIFPKEEAKKVDAKAANVAVLSNQVIITRHKITDARAREHIGKEGKPNTLRVDYYAGFVLAASEWVCINHAPESYPHKKAVSWWKDFTGMDGIAFATTSAAQYYNSGGLVPEWIDTKPNGKFTEIVRYGPLKSRIELKRLAVVSQPEEDDYDGLFE